MYTFYVAANQTSRAVPGLPIFCCHFIFYADIILLLYICQLACHLLLLMNMLLDLQAEAGKICINVEEDV